MDNKNDVNLNRGLDEFEFNQDTSSLDFEGEYRSPGWERFKKNKMLKWKK